MSVIGLGFFLYSDPHLMRLARHLMRLAPQQEHFTVQVPDAQISQQDHVKISPFL
jgi:hypothetical protein